MKTILITASVVCLLVVAAFVAGRSARPSANLAPSTAPAAEAQGQSTRDSSRTMPVELPPLPEVETKRARIEATPAAPTPAAPVAETRPAGPAVNPVVAQAIENLVSPQASHAHKQYAWQQLRDAGKLDVAITELEQRTSANPNSAAYPATLGQAYLQKAGTIQDMREQGILGMKADQSFEAALALDPSNWEARFWRTAAMSYWPSELGKSREVIESFLGLIKQQEEQSPQPQFAQTYLMLGDQYSKQGHTQYATQVWHRGASLFPDHAELRDRLSASTQNAQARTN